MVQFAKKLAAAQRPEWKGHYLEYKQLKKKLRKVVGAQHEETRSEQETFKESLDSEVERVVLFFLTKQGEFATTLQGLRSQQLELAPGDLEAMHSIAEMYRQVGDELVQLLHFVELNATGIRKILKKHDKTLKEHKIMGSYLSSRTDSQASHLQQLYHDEGISAIIASIRAALTHLRKLEVQLATHVTEKMLARSISEDEPVLNRIGQARRRLHKSTQYVKTVAARSLIFDAESSEDEDDETYDMLKRLKQASEPSRLLNMLNTFLYMTNYYIVAPTSGKYAAELGAEASMSGVIVGMTPVASLASAVLYSWWANRSYKGSLSFATVCLILGNLLYGMALSYDSVAMALTGRMLNGFGGARAINRRYIADNYSREERTQASALFVTASALGMAAGPALAAGLHYLPDYRFAGIDITTETSPGWIMFALWTIYLIALLYWFEEPDRLERERFLENRRSMLENGMVNSNVAAIAAEVGEHTPLVSISHSNSMVGSRPSLSSLWRNVPVVASLFIYIILKLVLECLITASSTIAMYQFGWGSTNNGVYLAALGLLMFPTNMVVGWMSYRYEDREIIMMSEAAMFVGVGIIVNYGHYSVPQFVAGGVIIFISTNVLEGVNMSLLSKTIPKGDTICEICHQTFRPGYTAPPPIFRLGGIPMNFRGNWGIVRRDLNNPRLIAVVSTDHDFINSDYDDYAVSTSRSMMCCRSVAIIFMLLLVLRHTLPIIVNQGGDYSFPLVMLLMLRITGIVLPIYIIMKAVTSCHRRQRQQAILPISSSDEESGPVILPHQPTIIDAP